jgi:LmbE family N-acetylglucosaminyl deacetylase
MKKRINFTFVALILLFGSLSSVKAQQSEDSKVLYQAMLDLNHPFTVMCVAAHPDDEDRDGLAYYRMKYGARTVIVTSTRGEGGQNSQGPELNEELGIVRMREMVAVARRLDALTFNLALPDFGFSKSAEETFEKWNRKEALRRMVYAIRAFQPDIIITQHDRKTGHGHHRATRILIEEAFDLAADRYSYPEQISARLEPWQAKRLFVRTLNKERFDTEFDVNEESTSRRMQYSRIAYEALLEHRTQGPWPQPKFIGERMYRYNLIKNKEGDFSRWYLPMQNLTEPAIYSKIRPLLFKERAVTPEQAALLPPAELISRLTGALNLVSAYLKTEGKGDRKARELEEKLQRAFLAVSKISFSVAPGVEKATQGIDFNIKASITNRGSLPVQLSDLRLSLPEGWDNKESTKLATGIEPGANAEAELLISLDPQVPPTLPAAAHLNDLDYLEPQIGATIKLSWKELNEPILISASARVEIAPAVEVEISPNNIPVNVIDAGQTDSYPLQVKIVSNLREPLRGRISITQNQTVRIAPEAQQIAVGPSTTAFITFLINVGRPTPEGTVILPVTISDDSGRVVTSTPLVLHLINVKVSRDVRVGYLRTFDNTIPQALKFFGARGSELSLAEIAAGNLATRFDTIILDNRAYLAYPELVGTNSKLIDFVRDGGTLLVFYQRPTDWNPLLSPYPIKIGDERVTDETAQVTILQPDHLLLNRPNKINDEDFNRWVQERGLSFPVEWDERYQALLSSADSGEEQLKGGLLVGEYGRGRYIYTSYVIYRQLRSFVPGAYHLFANMISVR